VGYTRGLVHGLVVGAVVGRRPAPPQTGEELRHSLTERAREMEPPDAGPGIPVPPKRKRPKPA
jgi:hypothetical protein